jgi:xanthine permease
MYSAAVAVPILLGAAVGLSDADVAFLINADLLTCGIATLIQTLGFWRVGIRLPLVMGVAFAGLGPMILIAGEDGLPAVYGAVIVAGVVSFLISPYWGRLLNFFPPVVTGSVILVIGASLIPAAVGLITGSDPAADDYAAPQNLALAAGVLLLFIVLTRFLRGFLQQVAILISLVAGTIAAIPLGMVSFGGVGSADVVGLVTPFHFGLPTFQIGAIISILIVMFVNMVEATGCSLAVGDLVGKRIGPKDIERGIRADGLATFIGGILNSFPYTTFAENTGLVGLTRVKSRFVVAAAGVILVGMGLVPKLGAVMAAVPHPVLGGASLAMFSTIAVIGIKTLRSVDFNETGNVMVVAVALGLGLAPVGAPGLYQSLPADVRTVLGTGIAAGSVAAFLMNLLFHEIRRRRAVGVPVGEAHVPPPPAE